MSYAVLVVEVRNDEKNRLRVLPVLSFSKIQLTILRGDASRLLDSTARLGLAESKCSCLLQNWDQSLVMEAPFTQIRDVLEKISGLSQHVDSLERMNHEMSPAVRTFMVSKPYRQ